jgi:hypothetical protein
VAVKFVAACGTSCLSSSVASAAEESAKK